VYCWRSATIKGAIGSSIRLSGETRHRPRKHEGGTEMGKSKKTTIKQGEAQGLHDSCWRKAIAMVAVVGMRNRGAAASSY